MNNFEARARDYLENHKDKIDPEIHFMTVALPTSELEEATKNEEKKLNLKTRQDILQALERPDVKSLTTSLKRSWLLNRGADHINVDSVLQKLDEQTRRDDQLGFHRICVKTVVRKTESLKSKEIKILFEGDRVNVVQRKGHCVQIDVPVSGWCSLLSARGRPIQLMKIDSNEVIFRGTNHGLFSDLLKESQYDAIKSGFHSPGYDWDNIHELKKMIEYLARHLERKIPHKNDRKLAEDLFQYMICHGAPVFDIRFAYMQEGRENKYMLKLINASLEKKKKSQVVFSAIKNAIDCIFQDFPEKLVEEIALFVPETIDHISSDSYHEKDGDRRCGCIIS